MILVSFRGSGALEDGLADGSKNSHPLRSELLGLQPLNGDGLLFDNFAEKGREEELITTSVVQGQVSVALRQAAELSGKRGQLDTVVAGAASVQRAPDDPSNEHQVGIFRLQRQFETIVEYGAIPVALLNLSAAPVRKAKP